MLVVTTPSVRDIPRTDEKREADSYELSFLDRIPDRTTDGRVSLVCFGDLVVFIFAIYICIDIQDLNRSELCDSLSTSIMQLMTDSPRRRSLPRSYNLSDSLLEDSVALPAPKSPRTAKELVLL